MITAYMKVVRTIQSAHYKHIENGSVINLINNFGNMYNNSRQYRDLMSIYNEKVKTFENNN